MNKKTIVDAFFRIANERGSDCLHGKWIPADYWAFCVNKALETAQPRVPRMTGNKLCTKLEHLLGIALDKIDILPGNSVYFVSCTKTKVVPSSANKSKEKIFFCLATDSVAADELPSMSARQHFFQTQYTKYESKIERRKSRRLSLTINTRVVGCVPAIVSPVEEEQRDAPTTTERRQAYNTEQQQERDTPVATITPTGADTASFNTPCSVLCSKLEALFDGIINPEILSRQDFFLLPNETGNSRMLRRIEELGVSQRMEANCKHYSVFESPKQYKKVDIATLDQSDYPVLTRFQIPLSVPAIRAVTSSIVRLAESVPEVMQLTKKNGGSKKTSGRVLAGKEG